MLLVSFLGPAAFGQHPRDLGSAPGGWGRPWLGENRSKAGGLQRAQRLRGSCRNGAPPCSFTPPRKRRPRHRGMCVWGIQQSGREAPKMAALNNDGGCARKQNGCRAPPLQPNNWCLRGCPAPPRGRAANGGAHCLRGAGAGGSPPDRGRHRRRDRPGLPPPPPRPCSVPPRRCGGARLPAAPGTGGSGPR